MATRKRRKKSAKRASRKKATRKKTTRRKKAGTRKRAATRKKKAATRKKKKKKAAGSRTPRFRTTRRNRDGYAGKDDVVERALAEGEQLDLLEEYFGSDSLAELRELAARAQAERTRGGPAVLILPGIMGSKLGRERKGWFDDVWWFDPIDVVAGELDKLSLEGGARNVKPLGVILFAYLRLKLNLVIAGYEASFHPFDWRQSLDVLGAELRRKLTARRAPTCLVAHSMGGLVARAALAGGGLDKGRVPRVIQLGTPNRGSFAPVQAMRGVYSVVRKVAALDLEHDAQELADEVFNTFPGLVQMLPFKGAWTGFDLYDPESWPDGGPQVRGALLSAAPAVQGGLAEADERFTLIAGVDQETVTSVEREGDEFVYVTTRAGDGTVPLELARLPDVPTYYVRESHGSLPNHGGVIRAVIDVLDRGSTDRLPSTWDRARIGTVRRRADSQVATPVYQQREGERVTRAERRDVLEELVSPRASRMPVAEAGPADAVPAEGMGHALEDVVVGRRRQHRLEVRLARGSITQVEARAYVLGIFKDVEPRGAALAIDEGLDGAVRELTARRMFSGNVGAIFDMPAGRRAMFADHVLFAGLGPFDTYGEDAQRIAAENVMRTLVMTRVEDFATVLFGTNSDVGVAASLRNMLRGFFRAMLEADGEQGFRRITFCELDDARYQEMKNELYRLASTTLFDEVEVVLSEIEPKVRAELVPVGRARDRRPAAADQAYLIVRQAGVRGTIRVTSSVLGVGSKGTVPMETVEVNEQRLRTVLARLDADSFGTADLRRLGDDLGKMLLHRSVRAALRAHKTNSLVVVHDAPMSRIPWETLYVGNHFPAAEAGLSRQYMAENLSIVKWLEKRRKDPMLNVLLVINPTEDLDGAAEEGEAVAEKLKSIQACRVEIVREAEATTRRLRDAFRSGRHEVVHYCGHAFFEEQHPEQSGIWCSDGVLSGAELAGMADLPALVFFNACQSARVRSQSKRLRMGAKGGAASRKRGSRLVDNVGLAEAFLRGGVGNYVGTYWPVGDQGAKDFADAFYRAILEGETIGKALQDGRQIVRKAGNIDWADYVHYGQREFVLKPERDSS